MKTHPAGLATGQEHPLGLADQDAAIDAYLDGLLRDPERESCWPADAPTASDDAYDNDFSEQDVADFEPMKHSAGKHSVGLSLVDLSRFKTAVIGERTPEEPSADALSLEMEGKAPVQLPEQDESPACASKAETCEEVELKTEHKTESGWQVFALGHLTVALPSADIFDIIDDSSLRPIPGAPSSVAGAVSYQSRSRMIVSLDDKLANVTGDACIVLLGPQGLWGVRVGAQRTDLAWDEAQTIWRTKNERNNERPWLMGVNRAAGVAFLAVESLRSALSAPQ